MKENSTQPYIREGNNTISFIGDTEKSFCGNAKNMNFMALWCAENIKIKNYKSANNIDISFNNVKNIEISDINKIGCIRLTRCKNLESLKLYNVGSIHTLMIQLSTKMKKIEIQSNENPKHFYANHVNAESVNINGQEYRTHMYEAELKQELSNSETVNIMEMNQADKMPQDHDEQNRIHEGEPESIKKIAADVNGQQMKKNKSYESGLTKRRRCATM